MCLVSEIMFLGFLEKGSHSLRINCLQNTNKLSDREVEPCNWHINKELFGRKEVGEGERSGLRSDSDSEGIGSLIGGTSIPLAVVNPG